MNNVFLGLGTNLGDRILNLRAAIKALEPHVVVAQRSSVYESAPHGVAGEQPPYLNMVIGGATALAPRDLLRELKTIERNMGRAPESHNEPRPIDLDILLYGDEIIDSPEITVPHARMHERAFVLVPLEEIAFHYVHPVLRLPIIDLLDNLGGYEHLVRRADEQL